MQFMSLHRTGQFNVNLYAEDSTQCGFHRGDRTCFFDVRIDSTSDCLDANGFILDNNEVQKYFDRVYATAEVFPSCELIALRAIADLRDLMGHDRCYGVEVTIRPGDYAGITARQEFMCPCYGVGRVS